jgi:hypothetical protein
LVKKEISCSDLQKGTEQEKYATQGRLWFPLILEGNIRTKTHNNQYLVSMGLRVPKMPALTPSVALDNLAACEIAVLYSSWRVQDGPNDVQGKAIVHY